MSLRSSQGSTFTMAHAAFNSGTAVAVPQIGGPGVPTPQSTPSSFSYQILSQANALKVNSGGEYADVTLEVAWDPTIGASGAKTHQELYTLGKATTKTDVTFVSSFPNGSGGFTIVTWVGQVAAANLAAAAGGGQIMTCTITPQSETSVAFA